MHQQKQSEDDNKFQTALENMRNLALLKILSFYIVVFHLNFPIDHVSLMRIFVMYLLLLLRIFIKMKSIVLVLHILLKKQDKHQLIFIQKIVQK